MLHRFTSLLRRESTLFPMVLSKTPQYSSSADTNKQRRALGIGFHTLPLLRAFLWINMILLFYCCICSITNGLGIQKIELIDYTAFRGVQ